METKPLFIKGKFYSGMSFWCTYLIQSQSNLHESDILLNPIPTELRLSRNPTQPKPNSSWWRTTRTILTMIPNSPDPSTNVTRNKPSCAYLKFKWLRRAYVKCSQVKYYSVEICSNIRFSPTSSIRVGFINLLTCRIWYCCCLKC